MPRKELTAVEKIELVLFKSKDEQGKIILTPKETEIKDRYQRTFVYWFEKPALKDSDIVQFMIEEFGIEKSQAYRDIPNIKYLLGNVTNASKAWYRYTVVEMFKETYAASKVANNFIAMVLAADKIGKYTQLDKDDQERMPWNEIVPTEFEASPDINILNPKLYDPNVEERRNKLRAKYSGDVQDIDFTEVKHG